ncbi:hypothetical protein PR202_gb19966 [Eleusine coracana subsp. coracana]|uniref:Uncharacterized protein n=1 Tax=Eleusine coracana subsp. coracana TaxID=191504 RepID=A0AAV5FB29_ELECO|nr:hypothetical protein QOZ80_3BG0278960 [Eleusine coracana subsp. coracana]GJN31555.1 hypothetical protein PR202_gb19966 [Eleusine coracana subsp. coracana]
MLLLRGARAASTAAAGATRPVSIRLTAVAALSSSPSSGGRRRKGQRRGEPKPPAPVPPQPLPRHGEAPGKKKPNARPAEVKKTRAAEEVLRLPGLDGQARKEAQEKPKRIVRWKCASGCGACCKLDKGPDFPAPDEIFADHPDHLEVYKSMIGTDGWCTNYDKSTRTCNIYEDRPFFCRVEPKVFDEFFGVARSRFDREACSACVDNIKMVYGEESTELKNFKRLIREESNKAEANKNQDKLLDT